MTTVRAVQPVQQTDTAGTAADAVTVATSDTSVIAANANRVSLFLTNDGSNKVYLSLGTAAAVSGKGISLAAGAGVVLQSYTGAVRGIASGGSSLVCIAEV